MNATFAAVGEVTPELVMELLRPSEVALSPDGSRTALVDGVRHQSTSRAMCLESVISLN
jgi:hypothetical protein